MSKKLFRAFDKKTLSASNPEDAKAEQQLVVIPDQLLDVSSQYRQLMTLYDSGIQLITTKLKILSNEFKCSNDRNPIENIKSRMKEPQSIVDKLNRKGLPFTLTAMTENVYDIAGHPRDLSFYI